MLITLVFFSLCSICWLFIMLFQVISDAIKSSIWNFRFFFVFSQSLHKYLPKKLWMTGNRTKFYYEFAYWEISFSSNQWRTTILHKIKYTLEEKKMRQYHTMKYSENKYFFYSLIRSRVDFKPGWYVCSSLIWFFA